MTIGLVVSEKDSADGPSINPAELGISAWAINSRRGILGRAIRNLNFTELKTRFFAEADPDFPSYYMLKALFPNAGDNGAVVWATRVIGAGSAAASNFAQGGTSAVAGELTSDPASFPADLFLPAGQATFLASVNAISIGTATVAYSQAALLGDSATYAAVTASNHLDVRVGNAVSVIVFDGTEATQADFHAAINAQLTGGYASDSTGETLLTTDQYGTGAEIEVLAASSADVLVSLGLSAAEDTGTGDVADARAVTALELKTIFDADFTGGIFTVNDDDSLTFSSNTTGGASSVQFTSGTGVALVAGFDTALHSGSADAPFNIWEITAGQYGEEDPGAWPNGKLYFQVTAPSSGLAGQVNLLVFYRSYQDSAPVLQETHKDLTNDNVESIVNHSTKGSKWIKVDVVGSPVSLPDTGSAILVSAGTVGANGATPAESLYNTALDRFNGQAVQLVTAPDLQSVLQGTNLNAYAVARNDVLALISAPHGATDEDLDDFSTLLAVKTFVAGYRGWLEVDDERGSTIFIPSIGHQIGAAYIRKLRARGSFPHIAPAGPTANFTGVVSVDDGVYDQTRLEVVNKTGFNPIVFQSGLGFFAKTSRTFSTISKWYSAHVRVQANYFKTSFRNTFSILEQEPNNEDTRRQLRNPIYDFMEVQYNNGGLMTSGGIANNLEVKCDESNNDDAVVLARRLRCSVKYRAAEVAEAIEIDLIRTTDGITAVDS